MKKLLLSGAAIALFMGVGAGSTVLAKGSESSHNILETITNTRIVNDTFPTPSKPYPWRRSDTAYQRLDTGKSMEKNERWEKYHQKKHPERWNERKDTMDRRDMQETDTTYGRNK